LIVLLFGLLSKGFRVGCVYDLGDRPGVGLVTRTRGGDLGGDGVAGAAGLAAGRPVGQFGKVCLGFDQGLVEAGRLAGVQMAQVGAFLSFPRWASAACGFAEAM